jgi:hypothetical protein
MWKKALECCFNIVIMTVTSDSTYTERYMGMPNLTDNYQGYDEGDLSKHVDQLKDKQFLLVSIVNQDIGDCESLEVGEVILLELFGLEKC